MMDFADFAATVDSSPVQPLLPAGFDEDFWGSALLPPPPDDDEEPATASTTTDGSPEFVLGSSSSSPTSPTSADAALKRARRMESNRASAEKSRRRKRARVEALEASVAQQQRECTQSFVELVRLSAEHASLRRELDFVAGLVAIVAARSRSNSSGGGSPQTTPSLAVPS